MACFVVRVQPQTFGRVGCGVDGLGLRVVGSAAEVADVACPGGLDAGGGGYRYGADAEAVGASGGDGDVCWFAVCGAREDFVVAVAARVDFAAEAEVGFAQGVVEVGAGVVEAGDVGRVAGQVVGVAGARGAGVDAYSRVSI